MTESISTHAPAPASDAESTRPGTSPAVESALASAGELARAALGLGKLWASYGLRASALALKTHAASMDHVAEALAGLDRAISTREGER